jgi:hypothetical protein
MSRDRHSGDIELYIDQLVLHGFARADRHRIGEAIRLELLRQIGESGLPATLTLQDHVSRLNAGTIEAQAGGKPEHIGVQVAQAVYGSVAGRRPRANEAPGSSPGPAGLSGNSA